MTTPPGDPGPAAATAPALEVDGLSVDIELRRSTVHAVDGVSLQVHAGESVGVVGESGCGKSTLGLAVAGLLPENTQTTGAVRAGGQPMTGVPDRELRALRGTKVGIVFQDPMTSLNPTKRIGVQVGETLRLQRGVGKAAAREAAAEMLDLVGLPRPRDQLDRYPHELSGGMRQRVVIASALICEPAVLVADEPTTALDVTTQSQILELFDDLRQRLGMALLLITHDMGVVAGHTDRVLVMYGGQEVEMGPTPDLFTAPRHRYTEALLASILHLETARGQALYAISGRPPDLTARFAECRFAARCHEAQADCRAGQPTLTGPDGHEYRCLHPADGTTRVPLTPAPHTAAAGGTP
jgi:oligopeptide/dipeptide ABC transporter ATP-binding protein